MKRVSKRKTYKRKVRSKVLRRSTRKSLRRSTKKKNTKKKSYRRSARKPLKRTRRTNKLRGGMWDKAANWFGGTDVTGPAAEPAAEPAAKPEKTPAEKAKEERDSRVEELSGVAPQLTADEEEEIDTIMQIEEGPKIIEKRFEREAEKYIQRAKRMGIDAAKISKVEGLSGFKKYSSAIDLFL